ncbi:MAG: hypothetical protein HOP34_12820, partial [Methylococcaceae bacterium]|nr:hypothetical protein [Methylococcaceae bacterium]
NYYGKTHVFGWSFYSQGSHNTFTNSQPFFSAFFEFLNKHRPKDDLIAIPKDEIEKARVLATCLQQQPCLLVLDGLEPLQYAQNLEAMKGWRNGASYDFRRLRINGLQYFFRNFS